MVGKQTTRELRVGIHRFRGLGTGLFSGGGDAAWFAKSPRHVARRLVGLHRGRAAGVFLVFVGVFASLVFFSGRVSGIVVHRGARVLSAYTGVGLSSARLRPRMVQVHGQQFVRGVRRQVPQIRGNLCGKPHT